MGSISDRSNPRYFLPLGLLLSASIIAACGLVKGIYASLAVLIALQTVNGWVQGMGWPACGKTMVHWFSTNERGTVVSVWNTAHNVGGALVASLRGPRRADLRATGERRSTSTRWWPPASRSSCWCCCATRRSRAGCRRSRSTATTIRRTYSEAHERDFTFRQIFLEHVLNNKYLWAIAVANAFMYFVRYGVVNWIPTYLQTHKGFSFQQSNVGWFLYEIAAIPGTIACGWVSDKVFKSRRAPATILFMALTLVAVVVYWLNINGPLWIDYAALIAIGFLVYGPIMLIGLHALDLVPKKAAGTAAGFTGFFGYVFGSAIAGTGVGWIADHWGWNGVFITMVVCCVLTMAFSAMTLGHTATSHKRTT